MNMEAKMAKNEDVTELLAKQADLQRVIGGGRTLLSKDAPAPAPEPAPEQTRKPPTTGAIYNARRSASNKEAGRPDLDAKNRWNPNQKRSMAVSKLATINEDAPVRKPKWNNKDKKNGLDMD
jgi:hypothetical protein